jgi:hypothetical protein
VERWCRVSEIRCAPRVARRPDDKARGGRISGICDRRATQPGGMHRRSNAAGVSPRAAMAAQHNQPAAEPTSSLFIRFSTLRGYIEGYKAFIPGKYTGVGRFLRATDLFLNVARLSRSSGLFGCNIRFSASRATSRGAGRSPISAGGTLRKGTAARRPQGGLGLPLRAVPVVLPVGHRASQQFARGARINGARCCLVTGPAVAAERSPDWRPYPLARHHGAEVPDAASGGLRCDWPPSRRGWLVRCVQLGRRETDARDRCPDNAWSQPITRPCHGPEQGDGVGCGRYRIGHNGIVWQQRLLRAIVYGVDPRSPVLLAAAISATVVAALLATYLPAQRAASVDPTLALRAE